MKLNEQKMFQSLKGFDVDFDDIFYQVRSGVMQKFQSLKGFDVDFDSESLKMLVYLVFKVRNREPL